MRKYDLVTLINLRKDYISRNLYLNVNGVILKVLPYNKLQVLFLNDKIVGDYAVVTVDNQDVRRQNIKLPTNFINELQTVDILSEENIEKKQMFEKLIFNECDKVELTVENNKYSKYGVHKGAVGYVAIDYAVEDSILVDFETDYVNNPTDCISVKIEDLKIIK